MIINTLTIWGCNRLCHVWILLRANQRLNKYMSNFYIFLKVLVYCVMQQCNSQHSDSILLLIHDLIVYFSEYGRSFFNNWQMGCEPVSELNPYNTCAFWPKWVSQLSDVLTQKHAFIRLYLMQLMCIFNSSCFENLLKC